MSVDRRWYVMVAAKVLERGAKRLGDSSLRELAEELRRKAKEEFKRGEREPDPLDFLDHILDSALKPLEEVLDKLGELL